VAYATPSIETVLGYTRADRIGRRFGEHIHPDDRPRFTADVEALKHDRTFASGEYRIRHQDGSWRTLEVDARNLLDEPEVNALVFNLRDVTDRNRMQKELGQLNRLTCIGRLSAQVAHEFNNVLMGMQTSVEVIRRRAAGDAQLLRIVDSLRTAIDRGKCITRDLLRYMMPAQVARERIAISEFLDRIADEIRPLLGSAIELDLQLPEVPLFISADSAQLGQVFTNLALNARDAMEQRGGKLTIEVRALDRDQAVHFTVTDEGEGIAPEDLDYIFEPLFTTKKSGTGLGLSVVRQIVTALGGHVHAESEKGKGTSIHMFLPAAGAD